MTNYVERVATAALLHDIGKFWSRTRSPAPYTEEEAAHFDTYAHALWSAHFVERYHGDVEITQWVRMHHKPDCREAYIVSLADFLASGERDESQDQLRGRSEDAALVAILSQLQPLAADSSAPATLPPAYLPLSTHGHFDTDFMPESQPRSSAAAYESLWSALESDLEILGPGMHPHGTWLALMCSGKLSA